MPRKTSSLVVAKKTRAPRRTRPAVVAPVEPIATHDDRPVCHECHALPIGSVELVSLLLVLVFSLSAVLLTSGYALSQQNDEMDRIQSQLDT